MRKCATPLLRKRRIQLDRASVPPRSPAEISDRFPISAISISRKKFRIFFGGLPPALPSRFAVRRGKARGRRIPPKPRRTARCFTNRLRDGRGGSGKRRFSRKNPDIFQGAAREFHGPTLAARENRRELRLSGSGKPFHRNAHRNAHKNQADKSPQNPANRRPVAYPTLPASLFSTLFIYPISRRRN